MNLESVEKTVSSSISFLSVCLCFLPIGTKWLITDCNNIYNIFRYFTVKNVFLQATLFPWAHRLKWICFSDVLPFIRHLSLALSKVGSPSAQPHLLCNSISGHFFLKGLATKLKGKQGDDSILNLRVRVCYAFPFTCLCPAPMSHHFHFISSTTFTGAPSPNDCTLPDRSSQHGGLSGYWVQILTCYRIKR